MHRASILLLCGLLGACAGSLPEMRPSSSGFASGSVLHPLEDGKRHLVAGRNGLAIRRFGEELGHHPRSLAALNGIAVAYARLGRHDVAHIYFERALELDPRDAANLNNYGRSLVDQGRLREARPFLEQALRHAGESDVPVIAANMLRIRQAPPPTVLAALRNGKAESGPRLVRVAADRYRLRTAVMPASGPATATDGNGPEPATPIADVRAALYAQTERTPSEHRPLAIALWADPPLPRKKPVPLQAGIEDPRPPSAPASNDELTMIRSVIEQRITGTAFDALLDDLLAPTPEATRSHIDQGVWT